MVFLPGLAERSLGRSLDLCVGESKTLMSYHRTVLSDGRPGVSFVVCPEEGLAMMLRLYTLG
jgi:hypothetical protein